MKSYSRVLFSCLVLITVTVLLFFLETLPTFSGVQQPLSYIAKSLNQPMRDYVWWREKRACKPRVCTNIAHSGVKGYWKTRKDLTKEEIAYRNDIDAKIRLNHDWPGSLYRNDSRCGMKFPIPGFRVQGSCDADRNETLCCHRPSGNCSSLQEHCNCTECTDYRQLVSAELADWVPHDPSCIVKNFTQEMTCDLLNNHNISIAFIGDSLIRQLARTLLLFVTGNRNSGVISVKTSQSDRTICYADHQITKRCSMKMKVTANTLEELEPNSVCNGRVNFKFDLVQNYKKYLPKDDLDKIKEYLGRNNSFVVMAIGLHYRLDLEAVKREYLEKVLTLVETEGKGWPKIIWIGIHAVPDYLLTEPLFNNKGILEFNNRLHEYLNNRNVTVIDTFDMTKQLKSYDGLHYGLGANYQKMHFLLNHLEEFYEKC